MAGSTTVVVVGAVVVGVAVVVEASVVVGAVVVVVGATVVVGAVVVGATVVVVVVVGAIVVVVGVLVVIEYTRTCPESAPFPSFLVAPIARIVPSDDNDTGDPEKSPSASPSISAPLWAHAVPFHS